MNEEIKQFCIKQDYSIYREGDLWIAVSTFKDRIVAIYFSHSYCIKYNKNDYIKSESDMMSEKEMLSYINLRAFL